MFQPQGQQPDIGQILEGIGAAGRRISQRLGGGGTRLLVILGLVAAVVIWLLSGIYTVEAGEQGVVRQFGKSTGTLAQPGLNYHLPSPIQNVVKVNVQQIRTAEIGFRTNQEGIGVRFLDEALMLTTDNSIVEARMVVQYRVSDPEKYVFQVRDPDDVLHTATEVALRSVAGRTGLQQILTVGRAQVELDTREFLAVLLGQYGTGMQITDVKLLTVDPPDQVKDAFQEVVRALEDETRFQNEADAYQAGEIPKAKGQVQVIVRASAAYHQQQIERATGEANRFLALLEEYRVAPQVTRDRLYLETLESVLSTVDKTVIDDEVEVLPLLNLSGLDQLEGSR